MEFAAFLVIYAIVVLAAWLMRMAVNKRDAKAAEAEAAAKAAAPARSKKYQEESAAPVVQKARNLQAVSAFQTRLRSSGKPEGRTEPSLNIYDDEAMARALGYASVEDYRDDKHPDAPDLEEDVLGSSSH